MDKRNNSSAAERIELLQKYVEVSLEVKPGGQLEDKKFIGEEWFSELNKMVIPFYLRVRNNFQIQKIVKFNQKLPLNGNKV